METIQNTEIGDEELKSILPIYLEINFVETQYYLFSPKIGVPSCFLWFEARFFDTSPRFFNKADMAIVYKSDQTNEWIEINKKVSLSEVVEIFYLYKPLVEPSRTLEVQSILDTFDGGVSFSLTVMERSEEFSKEKNGLFNLHLPMQISGFGGKDAAAVKNLLKKLFAIVNYKLPNYLEM